jgi:hypothetical protein
MSQNWTPPPAGGSETPVSNYLVWAIISACGCMWPLAIVAIVYSIQVNKKVATGDIEGARNASKIAKVCAMIAIGINILWWIVVVIYAFVIGLGLYAESTMPFK